MAVNQSLIFRNWIVGAYVVEYEQGGTDRAKYGSHLLQRLADDLAARGVRDLGTSILERCRRFYFGYPQFQKSIPDTLSTKFSRFGIQIPYTLCTESPKKKALQQLVPIRGSVTLKSLPTPLTIERLLHLSWTKLAELVRIDDPWKRAFYENECLAGNWSVRQLQRQIESLLYERTGLSTNKKAVIERGRAQGSKAPTESIDNLIRDPYVLEFSGLAERPEYSENDLETALLNHLQRFLLELGTGFCFEARQFRITINNKHNRVDLVFYNRRLGCHLLIDLKVRAFRHTDAGQMNFYLNWFKANMIEKSDNPPVGILLCSDKDHTEVEFATAGMDNKLFVSRYLTILPSAEQLKTLVEADRERLEMPVVNKKRSPKGN